MRERRCAPRHDVRLFDIVLFDIKSDIIVPGKLAGSVGAKARPGGRRSGSVFAFHPTPDRHAPLKSIAARTQVFADLLRVESGRRGVRYDGVNQIHL